MDRRRLSAYANLGGYTDGMGYINQPNVSMELRRILIENLMYDHFFFKVVSNYSCLGYRIDSRRMKCFRNVMDSFEYPLAC
jgi:hypothetical protein